MKILLTTLIIILTSTLYGQEFKFDYNKDFQKTLGQTKDSTDILFYDNLLPRFQKNDTTLTDYEILALLIGFTDNEYFKPYNYLTTEREVYSLNGKGKFKEAIKKCDSFLFFIPFSQQALIEKSYSFYKLGQGDSSKFYSWKYSKIMDAMAQSGDGLTAETAYFSLGPADGQNFLTKYLSVDIGTMGSGRDKYGNFVDILEATWQDEDTNEQKSRKLFFQVEHASKTLFGDFDFDNLDKKKSKKQKK